MKYKHVHPYGGKNNGKPFKKIFKYTKRIKGETYTAYFDTAREAAIALDKKLLDLGHEPINILVRK